MAFPTTGLIDDFNRANASTLGANYSKAFNFGAGTDRLDISGNAAGPVDTSYGEDEYNVSTFGPDSEVYATLATPPTDGGDCGMSARITGTGASASGYRVALFKLAAATDRIDIDKITGGSTKTNLGTVNQEFSAGDKLGVEVTGTSTTTVKVYRSASGSGTWDLLTTVTDSSSPLTSAGRIGLYGFNNPLWDDFSGGTVVASADAAVMARTFQAIPFMR